MDRNSGILYFEEDQVKWHPQLLKISLWKDLYSRDKHAGKKTWQRWIDYIYHSYTKNGESIYKKYLPTDRKMKVCENYLQEDPNNYIEYDNLLKDQIDDFVKSEWDDSEHMLNKLLSDMDNFVKYLQDIPCSIQVKFSYQPKAIEIDGQLHEIPNQILTVSVPNDDKKIKAYQSANEILKLRQQYTQIIRKEGKKETQRTTRKFEG